MIICVYIYIYICVCVGYTIIDSVIYHSMIFNMTKPLTEEAPGRPETLVAL